MSTLILIGLAVAVLLFVFGRSKISQPQPPQIVYYVQTAPVEQAPGTGCLPLLALAALGLIAILILR